jgi:hypothetical protein
MERRGADPIPRRGAGLARRSRRTTPPISVSGMSPRGCNGSRRTSGRLGVTRARRAESFAASPGSDWLDSWSHIYFLAYLADWVYQVTVFGQSAGAISISLLYLQPNLNLFSRAVSGTHAP